MLPKVQTFAWRLLSKALPTGMRAERFFTHISQTCCRCAQQEDEFHLFFLCDFARAAWFSASWFLRSGSLVQDHNSMHSILIHLVSMGHPYASLQNVLNFLWCIWKVRNDFLFERKRCLPYKVHIAAAHIDIALHEESFLPSNNQICAKNHLEAQVVPKQGQTLKSDMLINGTKIFSDAAFRSSKILGLAQGEVKTYVGVYFCIPSPRREINIQVQASAPPTSTPIQAEAVALAYAAHLAASLSVQQPTFLTDCLSLASAVTSRKIIHSAAPWNIRKELASFVTSTAHLNSQVFHISRSLNGVAHDLAQQVYQSVRGPILDCSSHSHASDDCPVSAILGDFNFSGFQVHKVYCF